LVLPIEWPYTRHLLVRSVVLFWQQHCLHLFGIHIGCSYLG